MLFSAFKSSNCGLKLRVKINLSFKLWASECPKAWKATKTATLSANSLLPALQPYQQIALVEKLCELFSLQNPIPSHPGNFSNSPVYYTGVLILPVYLYSVLIEALFYLRIFHQSWKPTPQIIVFLNSRNST